MILLCTTNNAYGYSKRDKIKYFELILNCLPIDVLNELHN